MGKDGDCQGTGNVAFTCIVVVIRGVSVCSNSSDCILKICTLHMYILYVCTRINSTSKNKTKQNFLPQELDFISVSDLFIRRISGSRYDMPVAGYLAGCSLSLVSGPVLELAWSWQAYHEGHALSPLTAGEAITCRQQQSTGKTRQRTALPTLRLRGTTPAMEGLKSLSI